MGDVAEISHLGKGIDWHICNQGSIDRYCFNENDSPDLF